MESVLGLWNVCRNHEVCTELIECIQKSWSVYIVNSVFRNHGVCTELIECTQKSLSVYRTEGGTDLAIHLAVLPTSELHLSVALRACSALKYQGLVAIGYIHRAQIHIMDKKGWKFLQVAPKYLLLSNRKKIVKKDTTWGGKIKSKGTLKVQHTPVSGRGHFAGLYNKVRTIKFWVGFAIRSVLLSET